MRIGIHVGHWEGRPDDAVSLAREAERLGLDSVWVSETWGSDAVATISWIAARTERIGLGTGVMQITARTPASTAMAALTIDHLSGGRFRLGLGVSGPQVVEGWHGASFDRPLARTRECVEIVRAILRREEPLTYRGEIYELPMRNGTGLGKPLKTNVQPLRGDMPIYLGAIGPANVALAAEIADGWIPFLLSPERMGLFAGSLAEGFARAGRGGGRDGDGFDVAPIVPIAAGEDLAACRDAVRPTIARYVGAMGARGANFYHALVSRYGYGETADAIQDAYLDGRRGDAIAAVPDALVDELALAGPVARIRDRLDAWRDAGATTLLAQARDVETVRALAEAAS
ncbi:MAG: LLM class F420-dependent oxidoreductase [Actinobacteria bacterium]|nr:LLM class F420-dependent oxidoreductase [Actinomycetota bacterium]